MKKIIAVSVVFLMIFSVFVVFVGSVPGNQSNDTNMIPMVISSYHGNITIEPNGTINASSSGAPIKQSGNVYTLTGNITGSITIERSSAQLNGAGYLITATNSYYHIGFLNISNSVGVSVKNLSISALQPSLPTVGVFMYNTSHDTISDLNISAWGAGIMVSNNTTAVNISNSHIENQNSGDFILGGITIGFYLNMNLVSSTGPIYANTTSDIAIYNDNISAFYAGPPILSNSNYTYVEDSMIYAGEISSPASLTMFRGGASVIDNTFNLSSTMAVNISNPYKANLNDLTVFGNTITDVLGSDTHSTNPVISTNGSAIIDNNSLKINVNNGGFQQGILATGRSAVINGNSMDFYNAGFSETVDGIATNTNYTQIMNNSITGSSPSNYVGIEGWEDYGNLANSTVSGNVMFFNSYEDSYGIAIIGNNDTFSGNVIVIKNGSSNMGIGMYANSPISSKNGFYTVDRNTISILNSGAGSSGIFVSTSYGFSKNDKIYQNQVDMNSSGSLTGMDISFTNETMLWGNEVTALNNSNSGSYLISGHANNNFTMNSNNFLGSNSGSLTAVQFIHSSYVKISNNSIANSSYGTSLVSSNNVTINGNYYTNTSIDALTTSSADNVTIYHNDFINYTAVSLSGKNIRLNLSYPIGGNYWSNLSGHFVDLKSGPDQNITGSDGINDTPFSPSTGVTDYYPLAYKWARPQAVFHVPSGLNGKTWKVTFNGITKTTTDSTISFYITQGTFEKYDYTYYNTSLYYTNTSNGVFSYTGSSANINIPYLHYSYITGHLNLTNFTVSVNGKQITVNKGSFNLTVTAGSYDVVITSTGYLTFNHTYNVTPDETLNVSPTLGVNHPKTSPPPVWGYVAAIVGIVAVAGGIGFYVVSIRKK